MHGGGSLNWGGGRVVYILRLREGRRCITILARVVMLIAPSLFLIVLRLSITWLRILVVELLRIAFGINWLIFRDLIGLFWLHCLWRCSWLSGLLGLIELGEIEERDMDIYWWHRSLPGLYSCLVIIHAATSIDWFINLSCFNSSRQVMCWSTMIKSHWIIICHDTMWCLHVLLTIPQLIEIMLVLAILTLLRVVIKLGR